MHDAFVKEFMMYDQKIRFGDAIKNVLKPKHYFYLIAQILEFALLIMPRLPIIANWQLYDIMRLILLLPTVAAFGIEAGLVMFAFDYYYIFPRLTNSGKDILRQRYHAIKNRTESN